MVFELLHVAADEHLPELDKVAVFLVVDLDDAPWVRATANPPAVRGVDLLIRTDDGEGDLALQWNCKRYVSDACRQLWALKR